MFNYGVYKRQMKLNKSIEKLKKEYLDDREKRKEINTKYSQNYKKRVENFVINMLENPLASTDYKGPQAINIRDENPEHFVGDAQIYVKGFKHEKDRIKEALEKNKDLDFLPNSIVASHQFRTRELTKEIHPDMRFKDKTSLERIEQFLKDHTQTQVENMDFNKNKKAFKFDTLSESMSVWEKRAFIARQIAKNLLPSLHQKTHFQATQTLYNNLPLSICENGKSLPHLHNKQNLNISNENIDQEEPKSTTEIKSSKQQLKRGNKKDSKVVPNTNTHDEVQETHKGSKNKGDQLETFNPIETSKQVLHTCNIIKKKNPKVQQIHQGDGHLISTLDRSISEMYMDIYNIDITNHGKKGYRSFKSRNTGTL